MALQSIQCRAIGYPHVIIFQVCLDADSSEGGTEIDCDDILCSLLEDCSLQKTRLAVMVLPVNDEWLPSCPSTPSTPTSQQLSATPATPVSSAEGLLLIDLL